MKRVLCIFLAALMTLMCTACAARTTEVVSEVARGQAGVAAPQATSPETAERETETTPAKSAAVTKATKAQTASDVKTTQKTSGKTTKATTYIAPLPVKGNPLSLQPVKKLEVCHETNVLQPSARICRSVNDFDAYSDLLKSHFDESDVYPVDKRRMPYVLKEAFDDAFFADKALLILYFSESDSGVTGSVESVSLDGSTLRINVALERVESVTNRLMYKQAVTQWLWVYELPADTAAAAKDVAVQSHKTVYYVD